MDNILAAPTQQHPHPDLQCPHPDLHIKFFKEFPYTTLKDFVKAQELVKKGREEGFYFGKTDEQAIAQAHRRSYSQQTRVEKVAKIQEIKDAEQIAKKDAAIARLTAENKQLKATMTEKDAEIARLTDKISRFDLDNTSALSTIRERPVDSSTEPAAKRMKFEDVIVELTKQCSRLKVLHDQKEANKNRCKAIDAEIADAKDWIKELKEQM